MLYVLNLEFIFLIYLQNYHNYFFYNDNLLYDVLLLDLVYNIFLIHLYVSSCLHLVDVRLVLLDSIRYFIHIYQDLIYLEIILEQLHCLFLRLLPYLVKHFFLFRKSKKIDKIFSFSLLNFKFLNKKFLLKINYYLP